MSRSLLGGREHQITHANGEIPAGAIIIIIIIITISGSGSGSGSGARLLP